MSAGSSTSSGPSERFSVRVGGLVVAGVLHLPSSRPSPCVVACHGMGASKDSDKYLLLGRELPAAGPALPRFGLRGRGAAGGRRRAPRRVGSAMAAGLPALAEGPEREGGFGLPGWGLGGCVALWAAASRAA